MVVNWIYPIQEGDVQMGMFDFLKKDDDDGDYEDKKDRNLKSFSREETEKADRMAGEAKTRFSTDYRSYLKMQSDQAKENLRRRTEAAHAMLRPGYAAPEEAPAETVSSALPAEEPSPEEPSSAPYEDEDEKPAAPKKAGFFRKLTAPEEAEDDDDDDEDYDEDEDDSDLD